jgi:hypothetical protein
MWNMPRRGFEELYEKLPGPKPGFEEAWRLTGGNPEMLARLYEAKWNVDAIVHSKIIEGLGLRIEGLTKAVGELKVAVGSIGSRMGLDLEKAVFNVYKGMLLGLGIKDVDKIEKFTYRDYDGRFFAKGRSDRGRRLRSR